MFRLLLRFKVLLMSIMMCWSITANAEQYQQFSNLEVHYIAIPSTFIQAAIAKQYNIKRSKNNALLNIAILDKSKSKQAVQAELTGTGKNLLGQSHSLIFTEIKEGDAIYYLANYPFINEEIVNFKIHIKTDKNNNMLKFQHKFYVD